MSPLSLSPLSPGRAGCGYNLRFAYRNIDFEYYPCHSERSGLMFWLAGDFVNDIFVEHGPIIYEIEGVELIKFIQFYGECSIKDKCEVLIRLYVDEVYKEVMEYPLKALTNENRLRRYLARCFVKEHIDTDCGVV